VSGREGLAARQAELVAALVAGAPPPPGLDAERVRVQAVALLRKRGRSAARAEPELAAALGREFGAAFAAYAAARLRSSPPRGASGGMNGVSPAPGTDVTCSADDAGEFARFLLSSEHGRDREVRRIARHITLKRLMRRAARPNSLH
jgi:hypothetical protein